jgi:hypothetical protein
LFEHADDLPGQARTPGAESTREHIRCRDEGEWCNGLPVAAQPEGGAFDRYARV